MTAAASGDGDEARVDVVELGRMRLAKNRLGLQLAREMDADLLAIRALVAEVERLTAEVDDLRDNPRDEYHSMRELYDYRMLYNAHAADGWRAAGIPVVKSWRHSDGEECFGGGWFIVSAALATGQVSNHYRAEYWDLFHVPEVALAPTWDGHTPADAADRLRSALRCDCDDPVSAGEAVTETCPRHPDAALPERPGPDVDELAERLRATALHHGAADAALLEEAAAALEYLGIESLGYLGPAAVTP